MPSVPKIVLPHGGYKNLIVYRKSDVVYEGTVVFCRRFLPARGEAFDKGLYSHLAAAKTAEELSAKAAALRRKIDQAVWSLRRRNGWEDAGVLFPR